MDDFLVHSLQLIDPECLRTCHGAAATTQEQCSPKARPLPCLWSGACHRQVLFPSSVSLCCWAISALLEGGGFESFCQGHEGVRRAYSCQESSIPIFPIVHKDRVLFICPREMLVTSLQKGELRNHPQGPLMFLNCEERPPLGFPEESAEVAADTCNDST